MGALHAGHLSLVSAAKATCDLVVASVFVNPTQFNDVTDFDKYPSTPEQDINLLAGAGCDVAFMPSAEEIYGHHGGSGKPGTLIEFRFAGLDDRWEGSSRPGHFSGVALVLSKLFHILRPTHVYMGQKDYQQLAVVRQLVSLLDFDLAVVGVPTMREPDGLAMSSRNVRLSAKARAKAPALYQALQTVAELATRVFADQACQEAITKHLTDADFQVDYLALVHPKDLAPIQLPDPSAGAVVLIAVWLDGVRLIDNLIIAPK